MTILATDDFNRGAQNPIGSPWVTVTGGGTTFDVNASNAAAPEAFGAGDTWMYYDGGISWPNDQYSKCKVTVNGTAGGESGLGPMVRKASGQTDTYYRLVVDHAATNNCTLSRKVASAYQNIVTFTQAWSDGDTWELRAVATTLSMWLNGTQVGGNQTDGNIVSGYPGASYSSTETSCSLDDWEGGDFAGGGGGQALDSDYLLHLTIQR